MAVCVSITSRAVSVAIWVIFSTPEAELIASDAPVSR